MSSTNGLGRFLLRTTAAHMVTYTVAGLIASTVLDYQALWALLVGVGIVSTYAASLGSIEGLIYTRVPLPVHLRGLPEVVGQAGAFSAILTGWYRHPHRAWGVVLGSLSALVVLASALGLAFG